MKIFLDTSNIKDITRWHAIGVIDGITTNPSNLAKEGSNAKQHIQEICALMKGHDVSVEVTHMSAAAMYTQAKAIAALAPNVVIKIPCHRDYYGVIKQLVHDGIPVNVTLVFTLIQGMLMAKFGVRYISPFVGRWDDIDVDGITLLEELRFMMDQYGFADTQILAASLRTVRNVHDAINAGADVATVPSSLLEKMTEHPLTDRGIQLFEADWNKIGIKQFP